MRERLVAKRVVNIVLIFLTAVGFTAAICLIEDRFWDEMLEFFLLDLMFFPLYVYALESGRAKGELSANRETDFGKAATGFFFAALILLFGMALPEFLAPVLLASLLLASLGSELSAAGAVLFLSTLLCVVSGSSVFELALYCIMALLGCMLRPSAERPGYRVWYGVIIFSACAMLPGLFYYFAYREVWRWLFLFGAAEGIVTAAAFLALLTRLARWRDAEVKDMLTYIADESYPLARELFNFSRKEHRHARRVSRAAERCARLVGADGRVCAAAGLYYRIGILEAGSLVENSVRIAQRECFPEEVVRILSEYNGERALPSSKESAIVHMVDGLIKKLEALDGQTASTDWNQDMVIYQTLNDFSATGLYDQSGLSMNMFLKIREYLVKEEGLLF